MLKEIELIQTRPEIFSQSRDSIWLDPYLSQQMLAIHLNPDSEGASRSPQFMEASVNWLLQKFPVKQYLRLLDLGCGPGLYAEKLYLAGYQVTGVDFAPSLDYARKSAQQKNYSIDYLQENYVTWAFPTDFELILLAYCDLGVFEPTIRQKLLKKIYASLREGGVFIFDLFTPVKYQDFSELHQWELAENNFWTKEACLHLASQQKTSLANTYLDLHYLIYPNHIKEFFIWETVFTPAAIQQELVAAGFQKIQFYGDLAGEVFTENNSSFCIVAQK